MHPLITFWKRFVEIVTWWKKVSVENPFPTKDIDWFHREWHNTVFWDRVFWRKVPTLSSQFYYPLESWRSVFVSENWGLAWISDSQLRLTTDSQVNSLATITGTFYLRYISWHEAYSLFTWVFDTSPASDSHQRIGLFDWNDWFYVGYQWSDFVIARIKSWVHFRQIIDLSSVFPEELWVFNPEFWNHYKISFGYPFAAIHFEVMTPLWNWAILWEINHWNISKETHVSTTFLPIRAELFNWSSPTAMEISSWSVSTWIIDGSWVDPWARRFSFSSWLVTIFSWNQTFVVFRNKDTYWWLENRVNSMLTLVSAATDWIKPISWRIIENPTITTPWTWADVNTADSIMDYNNTAVIDPNTWKDLLDWNMAKSDSFFQQVNEQKITLAPWDIAAIQINATSASDVLLSFRWEELF